MAKRVVTIIRQSVIYSNKTVSADFGSIILSIIG